MKNKVIKIIQYLICFVIGILIGLNIFDNKDVNHDGVVNAQDYTIIKKYIMDRSDK